MVQFLQRYFRYRRVGFRRSEALHFAWMVTNGMRAATVRLISR
jgi:hypothetical protein